MGFRQDWAALSPTGRMNFIGTMAMVVAALAVVLLVKYL